MPEGKQSSGLDFLKGLRFQWKLTSIVFLSVFLLSAALIALVPNKFESRLKLVVKNGRIDPLVGSDKQTQQILNINDVSEARINTEIQLLTSSKVLREVVQKCGLADLVGTRKQSQAKREELALHQLQRDLIVVPVRTSDVIDVSYQSLNPRRSAQVVDAVWQAYTLANQNMHGVPGSLALFQKMAADYDRRLASSQEELAQFRKRNSVASVPEEQTLALANVSRVRSLMAESAADEQRGEASARTLKHDIDTLPERTERDRKSVPNLMLTQQLTTLLVTLKNKRMEAAARYQPGDRLLTELSAQIAQTTTALDDAQKAGTDEVSTGANPARDVAWSEYLHEVAQSTGAKARTEELGRQLRKAETDVAVLSSQRSEYEQLVLNSSELEKLDDMFHEKREEALLEQSLDQQQISNLAIVDEPFVSSVPSSPKRGLLLSLAFCWSTLIAVVTAIIVEVSSGRIQSPLALGARVNVPLLGSYSTMALPPPSSTFRALYADMQRNRPLTTKEVSQ